MSLDQTKQISIDSSVLQWPASEARLIASRCRRCSTTTFPQAAACPRCCGDDVERCLLATRGTLWTWTTQEFAPKSPPYRGPASFRPFALGYVELPGEVIVETPLTVSDFKTLRIGMPMRLVLQPAYEDAQGRTAMTFAFAPDA